MKLENIPLRSLFAISRQMAKSGSPRFDKPPSRAERAISALSRKTGAHRSTIAGKAESIGQFMDTDSLLGSANKVGKLAKSAIKRAKTEKRPRNTMERPPSAAMTKTGASLRSVAEKAVNKAQKNIGSPLASHLLRKADMLMNAGSFADGQTKARRMDSMERSIRGITKSGRSKF